MTETPLKPRIIPKCIKILLIVVTIPILIVLAFMISRSIFDGFERNKFTILDEDMTSLYSDLKAHANKDDNWQYIAECEDDRSGPWSNGSYYCKTIISMEKEIGTVDELNEYHTKYFEIINNSEHFIEKTSNLQMNGGFGKDFNVSMANKIYTDKNTKNVCEYTVYLNTLNNKIDNLYPGTSISGNGKLIIDFRCSGKSSGNWYN